MAQGSQTTMEPLAWGLRGEKFTGHLAKKDQEVFLVVVVFCYFCLVTCGGFFPLQFKSQNLKAPSYLHLAALCKQPYEDLFGIMGIFSALICNINNLNNKEFTTTLRLCAMPGKYLLPQKHPSLIKLVSRSKSHGETNSGIY